MGGVTELIVLFSVITIYFLGRYCINIDKLAEDLKFIYAILLIPFIALATISCLVSITLEKLILYLGTGIYFVYKKLLSLCKKLKRKLKNEKIKN